MLFKKPNILVFLVAMLHLSVHAHQHVTFEFDPRIPKEIAANGLLVMQNKLSSYPLPLTPEHLKNLISLVPSLMRKSTAPYGYFESQCHASLQNKKTSVIYIRCDLKKQTRITDLKILISGPGKATIEQAIKASPLPIQAGAPFSSNAYEEAKKMLLSTSYRHGYMQANTNNSSLTVHTTDHTAQVTLWLNTGQTYLFGPITFDKKLYHASFLTGMAPFDKVTRYESEKLFQYQRVLASSGLFKEVLVKPLFPQDGSQNIIPVHVHYTPIHRYQKQFSLGYDLDTQVNIMVGVHNNRLGKKGERTKHELHRDNLFGSGPRKKLTFLNSIILPRYHPTRDYYFANIDFTDQSIVLDQPIITAFEKSINFKLGHTLKQTIQQTNTIERTFNMNFLTTWNTPVNNNINLPTVFKFSAYPSLQHIYTRIKDKSYYRVDHDISGNPLFLKTTLSQRLHADLGYRLRLIWRNKLGFIATSKHTKLPSSWNFLAGGNTSVRGFPYNSIGSELLIGNTQDGSILNKMLLENSTELQWMLIQNLYLIGYYDLGKASADIFKSRSYHAIGSGISWESPFGIIELSLARRLNAPPNTSVTRRSPCKSCRYVIAFKNKFY